MKVGRLLLQAARLGSFCVLMSFFLWTAHIQFYAPVSVARFVIALPESVVSLTAANSRLDLLPFTLVDTICLFTLLVVVATSFLLALRNGMAFALLKAVQVGSFVMLSLGLIILLLDPYELLSYMTYAQHNTGFATWFTNATDLAVSAPIFALTTYAVETRLPRAAT